MAPFAPEGVDHVALRVRSRERSVAWYREVLGLEEIYADEWSGNPAVLVAPRSRTGVALFETTTQDAPLVSDGAIAIMHVAFRVDRTGFEEARQHLAERGVEFSFEDHQLAHSIYFLDPDGHRLEITTYEIP